MDKFEFHVKSSSGVAIYCVHLDVDRSRVLCGCDCQAGVFGRLCKHKLAILSGDDSVLSDEGEVASLLALTGRLEGSEVVSAVKAFLDAEKQAEEAKKWVVKRRNYLEKIIHGV